MFEKISKLKEEERLDEMSVVVDMFSGLVIVVESRFKV